ncbi:unnamed protein product [Peronospora effusa]|uniref:Uncharacterized protein n=1 Tax=Peronospora effusa TaxID=542832 RepID=A0A3M6VSR3_9STRA|nr:hypothetical protein DD238_001347 [Peronospora effusa]CAI5728306.1 unnamed protein product [Peronospora effusa]
MHPRTTISRPSPKRSLSCAGLDNLDELIRNSDNHRPSPRRKRHQSLSNFIAPNFATPSSPSRNDCPSSPASSSKVLRRPDLPPFDEKSSSGGELQRVASSSVELRSPEVSSHHVETVDQHRNPRSDDRNNNCEDEHSDGLDDDYNDEDASYGGVQDYPNSSVPDLSSEEPQDVFEHRLKLDHDALDAKHRDHNMFILPSHYSSNSECSPREEFLVQAFGPNSFKLYGASESNNDESDESLSDDSSNDDRDQSLSNHENMIADADTELKMSFNELEADIRGAMHENPHHQQHSTRLPELADLPHKSFALPSNDPFGPGRSPSFLRNNQDIRRVSVFTRPQDTRPHLLPTQKEPGYFPGGQHHHSPSCVSLLGKTPQSKGSTGVQTSTKWLRDEDDCLREAVARFGGKNWKMIAETLGNGRTDVQCLHRWNKVLKPGLIKGPWTPAEDRILTSLITRYGIGKIRWCDLALHLPGRIGKQCRERWCNHLDSRIRKGQWTPEEDDMVFSWQQKLGNKWSEIAKLLPGRTENAVKNRFNSAARRKWLMNQASKSASSLLMPTTPANQTRAPHNQQHSLLQPSSLHQEGNIYDVSTNLYEGEKVSPLSEALEDHPHKRILPLERQNFIQHFSISEAPGTSNLDEARSFCPALTMGSEQCFQEQVHDTTDEATKDDSMPLTTPPTFVPPPLSAFFSAPTNSGIDADCMLHHLASGTGKDEGPISPVFPFPDHLPTQVQHATMPENPTPGALTAEENVGFSLLQLKEDKAGRGDLVFHATPDVLVVDTVTDASVPMDDENMNSFLDSVALELDEIME